MRRSLPVVLSGIAVLVAVGILISGSSGEARSRSDSIVRFQELQLRRRADFSCRVQSDTMEYVGYLGLTKTQARYEVVWTGAPFAKAALTRFTNYGYLLRRNPNKMDATVKSAPTVWGKVSLSATYRGNDVDPKSVQVEFAVPVDEFSPDPRARSTFARTQNMNARIVDPSSHELRRDGVDIEFGPIFNGIRSMSMNARWPFPAFGNSIEGDRGYESTFINVVVPEAQTLLRSGVFSKAEIAFSTFAVNPPGWDLSSPIGTVSGYAIEEDRVLAKVTLMAMLSQGRPTVRIQIDALGTARLPNVGYVKPTGLIAGPTEVVASSPTYLMLSYANEYIRPERVAP